MCRPVAAAGLLLLLLPMAASAQLPGAPALEAVIGLARRSPTSQDLPLDGFQASARIGYSLAPGVRVLTAITWTTFSDQERVVPILCPQGLGPCGAGLGRIPGLGMTALTVGLEPVLPIAGVELRPSGMIGPYWLYHHATGLPSQAFGADAGLALGLPIGAHERILLEGRWVHLLGEAGAAGNSRRLNVGLAFR